MTSHMRKLIVYGVLAMLGAVVLVSFTHRGRSAPIGTKEQLGEKLFFDPILSKDRTISCASCHKPAFGFADTARFSRGIGGQLTTRNTPSATNLSGRPRFFWDGRASSLEEQAMGPITSAAEMGLSMEEAVQRLRQEPEYAEAFARLYHASVDKESILKAIAAYERTLETANSPYDRFIGGDENALSEAAKRGRLLFIGKANCNNCHSGEDFTADRFKNIGLYDNHQLKDSGRYNATKDTGLIGFFKIPSLRNVAITAPYMHNGMFATLKQVVEYYNNPDSVIRGGGGGHRDLSLNQPLHLSEAEVSDVVSFLEALTDDRFTKK